MSSSQEISSANTAKNIWQQFSNGGTPEILGRLCTTIALGQILVIPLIFSSTTLEAGSVRSLLTETSVCICIALLAVKAWIQKRIALIPVFLIFPGLTLLALLSSGKNGFPLTAGHEMWRQGCLMSWGIVTASCLRCMERRKTMFWCILIGAFAVSVYAVVQKAGLDPIPWSVSSSTRIFSTVGNPNMLAGYFVAVLPILLSVGMSLSARRKVLCFLAALLCTIGLLLTECRGALLGIIAALLMPDAGQGGLCAT